MFASTELAARIERAEVSIVQACVGAIRPGNPDTDVFLREVAGGAAVFTGQASPINKVAGLGFGGEVEDSVWEELEHESRERGIPLQVELSTLGDPAIAKQLTGRGYRLVGSENVLAAALPLTFGEGAADVEVVLDSEPDSLDDWVDRVARGFAAPDTQGIASHETYPHEDLARVMRDFVSSEGMLRYTAHLEGTPAGGGAVRYHDGIAQLCGASTLPEQRLRGVQSALLKKRLADAAEAGCELATVVTQPGSKSCENVQRKGFALLYLRSLLVWEAPESAESSAE